MSNGNGELKETSEPSEKTVIEIVVTKEGETLLKSQLPQSNVILTLVTMLHSVLHDNKPKDNKIVVPLKKGVLGFRNFLSRR